MKKPLFAILRVIIFKYASGEKIMKKIITIFLGCSLLVAPFSVNANYSSRVKNLYRISAATGAIAWLTGGLGIALHKNLFKAPLRSPFSLIWASAVSSVYELVEFIDLMRKR